MTPKEIARRLQSDPRCVPCEPDRLPGAMFHRDIYDGKVLSCRSAWTYDGTVADARAWTHDPTLFEMQSGSLPVVRVCEYHGAVVEIEPPPPPPPPPHTTSLGGVPCPHNPPPLLYPTGWREGRIDREEVSEPGTQTFSMRFAANGHMHGASLVVETDVDRATLVVGAGLVSREDLFLHGFEFDTRVLVGRNVHMRVYPNGAAYPRLPPRTDGGFR